MSINNGYKSGFTINIYKKWIVTVHIMGFTMSGSQLAVGKHNYTNCWIAGEDM